LSNEARIDEGARLFTSQGLERIDRSGARATFVQELKNFAQA